MKLPLAAIAVLLPLLSWAQSDPLEPDDGFALFGHSMDGGQPDFTEPSNNPIGRIEGWRLSGRRLDGSSDLDWFIFNGSDYPYCQVEGEMRIIPEGGGSLRVEVLGYPRDYLLNSGIAPLTLQSCSQSPTGTTTITLLNDSSQNRSDFRTFYRLRSCTSQTGVRYRFEYRITNPGFCYAPGTVLGTVRDVRSGQPIPGAYIFSNLNDVTFSSPANGEFEMFVTSTSSIFLNFLAADYSSLGSTNVGPVEPFDYIENITLWGQPAGLIFFSGFE
ncbi:MAG: hypothetical protein AAGA23_13625 [Pseudomonadota bacterium]